MNADGTQNWRSTEAVPKPPPAPPMPRQPPQAAAPPVVAWLRAPRPAAAPGIWRYGHRPKPAAEPEHIGDRQLLGGALLALLGGLLVWSLCWNGYIRFWLWPLDWFTPHSWRSTRAIVTASYVYYALFGALLAYVFGRLGKWPQVWRRYAPAPWQRRWRKLADRAAAAKPYRRALLALLGGVLVWAMCFSDGGWEFWLAPLKWVTPESWRTPDETQAYVVAYNIYYVLFTVALLALTAKAGAWRAVWRRRSTPQAPTGTSWTPPPERDPAAGLAEWSGLRAAGQSEAADRLSEEVWAGRVSDLDYVRIERVWRTVRSRPDALGAFRRAALEQGAAAFVHPSGARDLSVRTAKHDLLTGQVRIGTALDDDRNPYQHRGCRLAVDPALLGTSLLAVGPPGSGKTGRIVRPAVEALCLQALAHQAAVVAVGTARAGLGPDDAFDVVVRVGDPHSTHGLDLYGGTTDPDEAAAMLAEALLGAEHGEQSDPRAAAVALAQLIGPYRAAYGRFPALRELRSLLEGSAVAIAGLREALDAAGEFGQQRELASRERQADRPGDPGPLLADRVALLDRPALADFFGTAAADADGQGPPRLFSLRTLEHPLRVRIDLPARGHTEASRILTRLVLAQFAAGVLAREDRSLFACLVLDDAAHTITPDAVRGLRQLRAANAGAVLTLRTLDDVPKRLHSTLIGTVGCKVALSGVSTWDGEVFAQAWGQDWVKTEDVTHNPDFSGGLLKRGLRGIRTLFTGVRATTESVTVRTVQRERWSASDLAHKVPPGHAVLSLTSVRGESSPPVLARLGETGGE
ncbi:ATP-binding protein [Streptomyces gobiensis]|uniref:ATP-binding protein n=1 Tax=Streptomyces gobiensis TaxID=2875706 RepID=UPI001E3F692E|nr:ATP-binding protein [Streptomyces gobiensis]UGY93875.1 ATP-binding protein [Streptomyces gobiensis]